jgi:hypothetical protein
LLRLRFRLWKELLPVPDNIEQFSKNKKLRKILPFKVRSSLFPRKSVSHFWFFDFLIMYFVGSESIFGAGTVVHSGSGPAKAKSYGSCGSSSTTLKKGLQKNILFKIIFVNIIYPTPTFMHALVPWNWRMAGHFQQRHSS